MSIEIIARMQAAFRAEAADLIAELDSSLLSLEAAPTDVELVNRVFRAIHTIKGTGATAGFTHMAGFAHRVEEAFDRARSGRLAISAALVDCGLNACDILRTMLGSTDPEAGCEGESTVIEALAKLSPPDPSSALADTSTPKASALSKEEDDDQRIAYQVTIRPKRELFYSGADPVTLLDELRELGQAHITAHSDAVPALSDLLPESCYLWWEARLVTAAGEDAIREVFSFVEDECDVTVTPLENQQAQVALLGAIEPESLELFVIESKDLLDAVEAHALALEHASAGREGLDAVFRAVHSIKGNANLLLGQVAGASSVARAALGGAHALPALGRMAHAIESLLEPYREGPHAPPLAPEMVSTLLEARDAMLGLLLSLGGSAEPGYAVSPDLAARLGMDSEDALPAPAPSAGEAAFRNTASQCLDLVQTCLDRLESGQTGEPILKVYQRGLRTLSSAAAYLERKDLDDLVEAQLRILAASMGAGGQLSAEDRRRLGEAFGAVRSKLEAAPLPPPHAGKRDSSPVAPPHPPAGSSATIRVDQDKLERLMRVVGELLVARAAIPSLAQKLTSGEDPVLVARSLKETGAGISRIAEELQASVMAIRMLPVKTVFQRFPRLIRDLARSLGKEVKLVVEGEDTELDKTILERIGDPLVHMVRNAVDHGIELPALRQARGKNPVGTLTLRARNSIGSVILEIADDGGGLDAGRLKNKAVERGLLTAGAAAQMSAEAAYQLVFLPGLSTSEKVTDVSGRGVGMDVVGSNIRELQGSVAIESTPGKGTSFIIKLPTSVMVSKGILLLAGGQEYILPLGSIRDMVKVPAAQLHRFKGMRMAQLKGEVYPVFSLAEMFGLPAPEKEDVAIAIIEAGQARYGLIADRFVSEVEVLIKPLSSGLGHCREFAGAAILGDGRVVLVLNPLECHELRQPQVAVAAAGGGGEGVAR